MTLSNGIYFGIPFEEYEKIERLSKTRIKQLLVSPADFWADSWLNPKPLKLTPEQERRKHMARVLGNAYHCARLEPGEFHDRYCRELTQADFVNAPGFITTGAAMGAELEKLGEKKSGSVAEQAERLLAAGYEGTIWQIELAKYEAQRGDRIALTAETFDQIVIDMERMQAVAEVHETLSNGEPEASILYDCPETGLPMKARLDWLRGDGWAEFKSFANPQSKALEKCLLDAIIFNRYYIDVACYHEAVEAVRLGGLTVQGEPPIGYAREIVEQIKASPSPLSHKIIFQQKGGVPNVLSRDLQLFEDHGGVARHLEEIGATEDRIEKAKAFAEASTPQPTQLMRKAIADIRNAKRLFVGYSEIYERGQPWQPFEPHASYSDIDFHPNFLESRA
jgi:hypothetical protein